MPNAELAAIERAAARAARALKPGYYFFGSSPPAQAMNCQRPPSLMSTFANGAEQRARPIHAHDPIGRA